MRNRVKTKVQPSLLLLLKRPFEEILPSRKVQVATLHARRLPGVVQIPAHQRLLETAMPMDVTRTLVSRVQSF